MLRPHKPCDVPSYKSPVLQFIDYPSLSGTSTILLHCVVPEFEDEALESDVQMPFKLKILEHLSEVKVGSPESNHRGRLLVSVKIREKTELSMVQKHPLTTKHWYSSDRLSRLHPRLKWMIDSTIYGCFFTQCRWIQDMQKWTRERGGVQTDCWSKPSAIWKRPLLEPIYSQNSARWCWRSTCNRRCLVPSSLWWGGSASRGRFC